MESFHLFITVVLLVGLFPSEFHVTDAAAAWLPASATFYEGPTGGACGYFNDLVNVYGYKTAALSAALFKNGAACGGCYQIVCDEKSDPQWCLKGKYITITATNFCPPNPGGGWCNPPREHFDMTPRAFETIAIYRAGIVPVLYRKVTCRRTGGLIFTMNGNDYFELVNISNVGGPGEVSMVWIKGSKTNQWETMSRNWGANWQSSSYLNGQSLSFRVQASNGEILTASDVVPPSWKFGQSFKSNVQFGHN